MRKLLLCLALICICIVPLHVAGISDQKEVAVAQADAPKTATPDSTAPSSPAYIDSIYTKNGVTYVTVDYIQFLQGAAADRAFNEHEKDSGLDGAPDGYYIINDDPTKHTFAVSGSADVLMQIYNRSGSWDDAQIVKDEPIALSKLVTLFSGKNEELMQNFPYYMTVVDGQVVRIVQQFIP